MAPAFRAGVGDDVCLQGDHLRECWDARGTLLACLLACLCGDSRKAQLFDHPAIVPFIGLSNYAVDRVRFLSVLCRLDNGEQKVKSKILVGMMLVSFRTP